MPTEEIRPDHVAIYIRWSTEDQGEGTTMAVQMEACRHYVASQGWTVREDLIFIDDGHSGGSLDRPAMSRLRKAVQAGQVDCVVVFKLDRLSRSVIDTVTLVLKEWEDLTYLKSAREPVDTTTAMGKQFFYMLVSYAEWERNVIRERMYGGKIRRAKEGRSPGFPAPYGYRKGPTPGTLEVVAEEASVVRLVYGLAEQGRSVRAITRHLSAQGYRSRKGAAFGTSMVSKMLRNPAYTGRLVWGRTRVNPRWKRTPGEARLLTAEPQVAMQTANIPQIVPREQFDRVQRVLAGNQRIEPGASGSDHLLTGLLRCQKCGRAMQYNAYQGWAYYRCARRQNQGLCDAPSLRAERLEGAVIDAVRERFERRATELMAADDGDAEQVTTLEANIAGVRAQLHRLETQERRINQDYLAERLEAGERRTLLDDVAQERARLGTLLTGLQADLTELREALAAQAGLAPTVTNEDLFRALPSDRQKELLRLLVQEIRAETLPTGDVGLTVRWKG